MKLYPSPRLGADLADLYLSVSPLNMESGEKKSMLCPLAVCRLLDCERSRLDSNGNVGESECTLENAGEGSFGKRLAGARLLFA